jgi:hypothetical protein
VLWLAGCAGAPPPAEDGVAPRVWLGEVASVLARADILEQDLGPRPNRALREQLLARGWRDGEIVDGSIVRVRAGYVSYNTVSGVRHERIATVPVSRGLSVAPGQVVEIEVDGDAATVVGVLHASMDAGRCRWAELPPSAASVASTVLGVLSMVGPPGRWSIDCEGLEKAGWTRGPGQGWSRPAGRPGR